MGLFLPLLLLCLNLGHPTSAADESNRENDSVVDRDVVVIGGGSSGTYAAIRLQQMGYSVALIEKEPVLGGHVNTFHDPASNETFDYGVISFTNITVVRDYFEYFDIPLAPLNLGPSDSHYADFKTDARIVQVPSSVPWKNGSAVGAALVAYGEQLARYPYLANGFNLPSPVPADFLISYGDFLKKYGLDAIAYIAFEYIQGVGNLLAQPTIYVMKYFSEITVQAILGYGAEFLTTQHHDNHELYDKALAKLGSSAFVSSRIVQIERGRDVVRVAVATPCGFKTMRARKLLVAIPPKLENLKELGLDLGREERSLFAQFNNSYYWDMVIRNSGIPDNVSLANVDLSAPLGIPALPGLYTIASTGLPGLHDAWYSSPYYLSDDDVKDDILRTLAKIVNANGYTATSAPEFVAFNNHSPFELTVSVEAIRNGFYDRLNALQGARNTWWTGATWQAQDSTLIWNWTEHTLLPNIVGSLSSKTHAAASKILFS